MEDPTGSAISGPPGKGELSRKGRTEPSTPSGSQSTSGDPSSPGIAKPPVASWARCSRSCLMPGIIRCPESAAIQAGNPDHRGRGEEPGVSACSAGPGFGFRVGVVNARTALSSSSRSAFRLRGWSPGGGGCGRMPVGGSVSLRRQATCGDGGPGGIAARMLAASPAGMPAVLALPRDHGGHRLACGGLARGRFAAGAAHDGGLVLWRAGPVGRSRRVPLAGRGA